MDKEDIAGKAREQGTESFAYFQELPTTSLSGFLSRLMTRSSSNSQQEGREGKDWLKEQALRYAERVLFASGASEELKIRDRKERQQRSGADSGVDDGEGSPSAGLGGAWRRMFLRLCRRMLEVRALTGLANQLSQCVRNAHHIDSTWQLEFVVSNRLLARTQVILRCEPPALQLRFRCLDEHARQLLEDNVMLLHSRLGAMSRHRLSVEIEMAGCAPSDDIGEAPV